MTPRLSDALLERHLVLAVDRRSQELATALQRHGATVTRAPALKNIPHIDDAALLPRTRVPIAAPPQLMVVTPGIGSRGCYEAAIAAGLDEQLHAALAGARILARGPKARGAIQQAGLVAHWLAESELSVEIRGHLRPLAPPGRPC